MQRISRGLMVLALPLLASCSEGGGDELAPFKGSVLGGGHSLASLNDRADSPAPEQNGTVAVTGARVTWVDQYDETHDGKSVGNIFLQDFADQAGPYEGIIAFQSSYSPPSFRTSVGDVVDVVGPYQEYASQYFPAGWTLPELSGGKITLRFDAPYIPIVPAAISLSDLSDYTTARHWLSMVVTAQDVMLGGGIKTDPHGRVTVQMGPDQPTTPLITNELFDLGSYLQQVMKERGLTSVKGLPIASVTGIVTMFYQAHIAPRSADDIVLR